MLLLLVMGVVAPCRLLRQGRGWELAGAAAGAAALVGAAAWVGAGRGDNRGNGSGEGEAVDGMPDLSHVRLEVGLDCCCVLEWNEEENSTGQPFLFLPVPPRSLDHPSIHTHVRTHVRTLHQPLAALQHRPGKVPGDFRRPLLCMCVCVDVCVHMCMYG